MTRENILEAAAQVFRQKGFHGASMQDIAEAVNLQKASLYHHVSSKQEILLRALLDRALELLLERISPICQSRSSCRRKTETDDSRVFADPGGEYRSFRRLAV